MLLRRFAQSIQSQNLATIALELLVLVIGIFLGLQVDGWNEARKDAARSRVIVDYLIADMARIEEVATANVEDITHYAQATSRVIHFLRSDAESPDDPEQFLDDLDGTISSKSVISRSPTMIELLSSGETRLIDDDELRLELIRFDQLMQEHAYAAENIFSWWQPHTEPLTTSVLLGTGNWDSESLGIKEVTDYDIDQMRAHPTLVPSLGTALAMQLGERYWRERIRQRASALRQRLEALQD